MIDQHQTSGVGFTTSELRLIPSAMTKLFVLCTFVLIFGVKALAEEKSPSASKASTQPALAVPSTAPAGRTVKLPGILINLDHKCVDLKAEICLDRGTLELVACTKGTKEHESIVAIEAWPMHVHTALLLIGANNGHPAMREPANKERSQWIDLPPKGDRIGVSLVFEDAAGKQVERPISDFVSRTENAAAEPKSVAKDDKPGETDRFPDSFVFAGSHLRDQETGPRQYLADLTGNLISISTFGDEVMCLPRTESQEDGMLSWQVDATYLPKIGSKVVLRLRPEKPPVTGTKP